MVSTTPPIVEAQVPYSSHGSCCKNHPASEHSIRNGHNVVPVAVAKGAEPLAIVNRDSELVGTSKVEEAPSAAVANDYSSHGIEARVLIDLGPDVLAIVVLCTLRN